MGKLKATKKQSSSRRKQPKDRLEVDLTQETIMNPDALPTELRGWRRYRIEYGGHAERCLLETPIYLPPSADPDKLWHLLNWPARRVWR